MAVRTVKTGHLRDIRGLSFAVRCDDLRPKKKKILIIYIPRLPWLVVPSDF
jgi:hypothetical protein